MKLISICLTTAQAAWANWEPWGDCDGECFEGRRTRLRDCNGWNCEDECQNLPGEICDHLQTERGCSLTNMCTWDQWADWSSCSVTCGDGNQNRDRKCQGSQRPAEHCGGGDTSQSQSCNEQPCDTYTFGEWTDWGACSATCGGGRKKRTRDCLNSSGNVVNSNNCNGRATGRETCASNDCPYTFDDWTNWGACSVTCGGGTKRRTRDCLNNLGNVANSSNCNGRDNDSGACAANSCSDCEFNQWTDYYVEMVDYWEFVVDEEFTSVNDCSAYCAVMSECKAFYYESGSYTTNGVVETWHDCGWSTSGEARYSGTFPAGTSDSQVFGLRSTESTTQTHLPKVQPSREPCGVKNDVCPSINSDFGTVKYKDNTNSAFEPKKYRYTRELAEKFIITNANTADCARTCWETAGCSSYYVTDECRMLMGSAQTCNPSWPGITCPDQADVVESGRLSNFCNNNDVFSSSFFKKSTFYCELFTQIEEDELIQQLKDNNGVDASATLGSWTFETPSTNPLSRQSQLIDIYVENPNGVANSNTQAEYTWIQFTFETYTRSSSSTASGRRKRSTNSIDIDADAINRVLTSLNLPAGVTVIRTTEPEVLEFVQVTPAGDVAADCSSGVCVCENGFVDNGSGCEFDENMFATPEKVLPNIREAIEFIFDEANFSGKKQDNKRQNLKRAWTTIINKIENQDNRVKLKNCHVDDVNVFRFVVSGSFCKQIGDAANGLDYYAAKYTNDCTKENRGKNMAFHSRVSKRLRNLLDRAQNHLAAGDNC